VTISQLNKKVDVLYRNNVQQQNEKNSLLELLKLVKKGVDDQSITFSNRSLVYSIKRGFTKIFQMNNFLGQFAEICQHSIVDSGLAAPQTTTATLNSFTSNPTTNQGRNFIGGSPHKQTMESLPTNPMMSLSNLSNFDSNDRHLRTSIENMMNLSVQKMRGDLSAEESLPSKRSKAGVSFVKSPHTNRTNYEEAKQWLQNTDRDTADFLNYLEKFQKENVNYLLID